MKKKTKDILNYTLLALLEGSIIAIPVLISFFPPYFPVIILGGAAFWASEIFANIELCKCPIEKTGCCVQNIDDNIPDDNLEVFSEETKQELNNKMDVSFDKYTTYINELDFYHMGTIDKISLVDFLFKDISNSVLLNSEEKNILNERLEAKKEQYINIYKNNCIAKDEPKKLVLKPDSNQIKN